MDALKPAKTKRRKKTAPAPEGTPIGSVRRALELMKPRLAVVLPAHLPVDRLLGVVMATLQSTPELLDCDRESLYRAVATCAHLGLEPDGVLGQAWLVPSRGKVQLVPGSWGLLSLARDSGQVVSINAQAVHRNDHFDYAYGLNERLEHVPGGGDRGEITHFYAYARLRDGGHCFEVMSRAEVEAARPRGESSPVERGKKAVLLRIARLLPPAVRKAAALAELHESGRYAALDDLGEIVVDLPVETETPRVELASRPEPSLAPRPLEVAAVELSEEELYALLPPLHILEVLDAVAEREMPEETLESIVGKPLDEVTEGEIPDILRAIALWRPDGR